jgi:hypothetical protein
MQSPVPIEFQGMDHSDAVDGKIIHHVEELEARFGRVTAGHVVALAQHPPWRMDFGGVSRANDGLAGSGRVQTTDCSGVRS